MKVIKVDGQKKRDKTRDKKEGSTTLIRGRKKIVDSNIWSMK